jgi:hypothetical protein
MPVRCQYHTKLKGEQMEELISKIQEWLVEDRENRSATIPVEYLVRLPEAPEVWLFDHATYQGKLIKCLDDMVDIDFKGKQIAKLKEELAKLEAI